MVLATGHKLVIQHIVGIHTVSTYAYNRLKQILLCVMVNIKLPQATVLFFFVQLGNQRVNPTGNVLFVRQISFRQRRLINQLFQQRFRETTFHTANHFLRRVVFRNQFL